MIFKRGKAKSILIIILAYLVSCLGGGIGYVSFLLSPELVGEHHLWPHPLISILYALACPILTLSFILFTSERMPRRLLLILSGLLYLSVSNFFVYMALSDKKFHWLPRLLLSYLLSLVAYTVIDNILTLLFTPTFFSWQRIIAEVIIYSPTGFYFFSIILATKIAKGSTIGLDKQGQLNEWN